MFDITQIKSEDKSFYTCTLCCNKPAKEIWTGKHKFFKQFVCDMCVKKFMSFYEEKDKIMK